MTSAILFRHSKNDRQLILTEFYMQYIYNVLFSWYSNNHTNVLFPLFSSLRADWACNCLVNLSALYCFFIDRCLQSPASFPFLRQIFLVPVLSVRMDWLPVRKYDCFINLSRYRRVITMLDNIKLSFFFFCPYKLSPSSGVCCSPGLSRHAHKICTLIYIKHCSAFIIYAIRELWLINWFLVHIPMDASLVCFSLEGFL